MQVYPIREALRPYVHQVLGFSSEAAQETTRLPFFADGFPGLISQQAPEGMVLMPRNKGLSPLFLYGQTLAPIELTVRGSYQLLIFQLFPFVSQLLFGVNPKTLNDDCWDLTAHQAVLASGIVPQLQQATPETRIEKISDFLENLISRQAGNIDHAVQLSIHLIIQSRGTISMKALREHLCLTERTFERRFGAAVGVPPKQFAKIIQFQASLNQLSADSYARLMDVVHDGGFADQSHFIKTFKKWAGKTPTEFKKPLSA